MISKAVALSVHLFDASEEEPIHDMFVRDDGYDVACTPSRMTVVERLRFSWRMLREVWTN